MDCEKCKFKEDCEALDSSFPNYIADKCKDKDEDLIQKLRKAHKKTNWKKPLSKPSIWRKLWIRILDMV